MSEENRAANKICSALLDLRMGLQLAGICTDEVTITLMSGELQPLREAFWGFMTDRQRVHAPKMASISVTGITFTEAPPK